MTWYLDPDTGDLYAPDGSQITNLGDPPYAIPGDPQEWAYALVKDVGIDNLTTEQLFWLFEVAGGEVEYGTP